MKISIITVTYNCVATLQATIDSVAQQEYPNVEYLVVDGGSTDGTVELIAANVTKITKWVSEPDKGIYDAMNKGLAMATGDFIYFLGGDDVLYPQALRLVVAQITDPQAIYYGHVRLLGREQPFLSDRAFNIKRILRRNICHQAIFYPANIFKQGAKYDLAYKHFADYVLNMDLWGRGERFVYVDVTVADYWLCGASSTGDALFVKHRLSLVRKKFGLWTAIYYLVRIKWLDWFKINILRHRRR